MKILTVFVLLLSSLLLPTTGYAVVCTVQTIAPVNFSNVTPISSNTTTTTLNWKCTKEIQDTFAGYTLCFNIGPSPVSGDVTSRQMSLVGSSATRLNYQLYRDAGGTQIWGSQFYSGGTYPIVNWDSSAPLASTSGSMSIYGRTTPPQPSSSIPGSYTDNYSAVNAFITILGAIGGPPRKCGTTLAASINFSVTATLQKWCNINFTNNLNFGSIKANKLNSTAASTLGVICTSSTAYTIGLTPSNNSSTGGGQMKGTGANTDKVPYQLSSTPGPNGITWGNTSQNTVQGVGTGSVITHNIYATIPNANFVPDNYSDIVNVNVIY